jgi:TetR/AcrR family transcriptional repressor of mexJK operon
MDVSHKAVDARLAGRPKDMEKRAAILAAASRLFLEYGFARATMEAIAQAAGVSKLTVYNHFTDKAGLFEALIHAKCEDSFGPHEFIELAPLGVEAALTRIAQSFVALMFHPEVISLQRVLMTNTGSESGLNRTYWQSGPAPTLAGLAELLTRFDREGLLAVPDRTRAADQFFSMLKGIDHLRALVGVGEPLSAAEQRGLADAAVAMFMRAYAPSGRGAGT